MRAGGDAASTRPAMGGRMANVTVERIAAVHAHVAEAVTRTTPGSTLPEADQDRLLAQGCAEACDLLKDWLLDPWWQEAGGARDTVVKEHVPTQKEFAKFLGPMLTDVLTRAGMNVDRSLVDGTREKVAATARRYPRMRHQQLFELAKDRVDALQQTVCKLAAQAAEAARPAADPARRAAWKRLAHKALSKVPDVLLAAVLAMAFAGPHAVAGSTAAWGEAAAHAAQVVSVHYLADRAQPGVRVAPPRAGPGLR
jgi:hypothetical protein